MNTEDSDWLPHNLEEEIQSGSVVGPFRTSQRPEASLPFLVNRHVVMETRRSVLPHRKLLELDLHKPSLRNLKVKRETTLLPPVTVWVLLQ